MTLWSRNLILVPALGARAGASALGESTNNNCNWIYGHPHTYDTTYALSDNDMGVTGRMRRRVHVMSCKQSHRGRSPPSLPQLQPQVACIRERDWAGAPQYPARLPGSRAGFSTARDAYGGSPRGVLAVEDKARRSRKR